MRRATAARRESKNRKEQKMIRNLKVLGLALVAVFAMSALAASAASAAEQGKITSDGPFKLDGTDVVKSVLTYNETQKLECTGTYTGEKVGGGFLASGETTATVKPVYTACVGKIGELNAPATVTMNGCDYVLHVGNTLAAGKWGGTADVVCSPSTDQIEVHIYSNAEHTSSICTYKFAAQTGKTGAFVTNIAGGITLGGTVEGVSASRTGILCGGTQSINTAKLDIDSSVTGTNNEGAATGISISD